MRPLLLVVAVLLALSCERRMPIDGVWYRGGVSGDHFGYYVLVIQASGNTLSGYACSGDLGAPPPFDVRFHDAPVTGEYPWVQFTVVPGTATLQSLIGQRFVGRLSNDGASIAGNFGSSSGTAQPITFSRLLGGLPAECGSER